MSAFTGAPLNNIVIVHAALELRMEQAAVLAVSVGDETPPMSRADFCTLAGIAYDDTVARIKRVRGHYTKDEIK